MSPFSVLLSFSFAIYTTHTQSYPFQTWMEDWSSSDASDLGVSIHQSTIYDIVLPGAHNAAMSFSSSDIITSPSSQDAYVNTLNSLPSNHAKQQWAQRQTASILELLKHGVRFLDLQFLHEANTDTFYAYNGLLGRSITDVIDDITDFLSNTGIQELILIYLHDFIYSGSSAVEDTQLTALLNTFATDSFIQSKLAISTTHNIYSRTIDQLINTDDVQIIMFTDQYPNSYANSDSFYDANTYLFLPKYGSGANDTFIEGQLDQVSEVRSFVISNLRYGWPQDKLNLIDWTLDIGSSFTEQHIYSSMLDFSSRLNNELNNVLNTYNKLWFANIIMVDFFEISDVMEQLLLLNYDYANCRDDIWGNNATDCPALTDLQSKYSTSSISPLCDINTNLQTDCERSCGGCSSSSAGNPGDTCANDDDCDGVLYGFYSSNGQCFIRPDTERAQDNINLESFCLTIDAQSSCANKEVQDKCGNNTADDVSSCDQYCSSNWQCEDGFCNTKYSVCMTLLESSTTTGAPSGPTNDEKYDFIVSKGAEQMLSDVALFRPGDYEAPPDWGGVQCVEPGADCVTDAMNANPYLASLVGFAIIPFFMALALCFCYTSCCCPCWCICDQCGKKCCCCHLVMKNPIEDGSKCKQYTPLVFLSICLIVVMWACIEGIVNNAEMHDHLFGEANSVAYAVNHLFDEVIGRFEAIEPTAEYIIDSGVQIMDDIFGILEGSTDSVGATLDQLYAKLDVVAAKFSNGTSLSAQFVDPFGSRFNDSNNSLPIYSTDPFVIVCDYCDLIPDQAMEMKQIINGSLGQAIGSVDQLMNETRGFLDAKDMIKNLTSGFLDTLNEVINTSVTIQNKANEYIDTGKEYDQTYRETPATIFFIIPMGLLIFTIAGVLLKNKWCFKCQWFCAMYCCGIPIMLLSWPFIFFAVLWGDICVRLDDFERNLQHSQLGQLAGLDSEEISPDDPRMQGLNLVNTCWHGGSPLDMFNLTQTLNWDILREQLESVTDVDLTSMLDSADISSFQTGIDTLDVGEFEGKVDGFIAHANSLGEYCGCGQRGSPFTRDNLYRAPKFDYCAKYEPANYTEPSLPYPLNVSNPLFDGKTFYWKNTTLHDSGECELAFINASAAVQIITALTDEANDKIAEIKGLFGDAVFDTYDDLFKIAANLEDDISTISCLIEPLFDEFSVIIDNFTNCGFIGVAYGHFKEAGCVNLFDDWYKIARAMAIIAYISIMIVFMALCLDYVYGPVVNKAGAAQDEEFYEVGDNVMEMQPTGHNNAASGVELPPGSLQSYPQQQQAPGSIQSYPQAQNGTTYMVAQPPTMVSSLGYQISPMAQSYPTQLEASPGSAVGPGSVHSSVVVVAPYQPQPEIADSDHQNYMIEYDNEPNQAPVHAMVPIASHSNMQVAEGGFVEGTGALNMDEPILPPEQADDNDLL